MPLNLEDKLVIGVSSRALFDLESENEIFEKEGLEAYSQYQVKHENDILKPGTAFPLIKSLQKLNADGRYLTEILVMSKNSADTSLRIFNSIDHYKLNISRAALVGGASISPYLTAFKTDLFLSANETDVQEAINANIASGIICDHSEFPINTEDDIEQIRIAFDGDAVIFSDESEKYTKKKVYKLSLNMNTKMPKNLCLKDLLQSFSKPYLLYKVNFLLTKCRLEHLL